MRQTHNMSFGTIHGDVDILPLSDVAFFQEGPGLRKWQWTDDGMKVINGRNILLNHSIDLSNTDKYISLEEFNERYTHFAIEAGDIVVTSSGTIGKVGLINESHLPLMMNTSVIRFHPLDPESVDSGYLYAFLRSEYFKNQANSYAIGAAQQNFGPVHLKLMKVPVPSIGIQKKIASILSNYDVLIENNTSRIAILEKMTHAIYREWFVKFRFPGHQNVKFVESQLGLIPEEWRVVSFEEIVSTIIDYRGKTPKKLGGEWSDSGVMVLSAKIVKGGSLRNLDKIRFVNEDLYQIWMKEEIRRGDVIMTSEAPMGELYFVADDARYCLSQRVFALRAKQEYSTPAHLYHLMQSKPMQSLIISRGTGATVKGIRQSLLRTLPTLVAPTSLLDAFEGIARPMRDLIDNFQKKNRTLEQTRNLLLRKLISGNLDVEHVEIEISESKAKEASI